MNEYKNYLNLWQHIRSLNATGVYTYGEADCNRDMQPCIYFDNSDQRAAYKILSARLTG